MEMTVAEKLNTSKQKGRRRRRRRSDAVNAHDYGADQLI
jgi:hypothetical protein